MVAPAATPREVLINAAASVARYAARDWEQFLAALAAYTDQQISNCISSPIDQLPVMQGRAQHARDLLALLSTCVGAADQIKERRK